MHFPSGYNVTCHIATEESWRGVSRRAAYGVFHYIALEEQTPLLYCWGLCIQQGCLSLSQSRKGYLSWANGHEQV